MRKDRYRRTQVEYKDYYKIMGVRRDAGQDEIDALRMRLRVLGSER